MPRFRFSLETLLRHREDIEQRERDELLRLNYRYETARRAHAELLDKLHQTMEELGRRQAQDPADEELEWFRRYVSRLMIEVKESERRLSEIEADIARQKEIVIEASRNKKVLSTLKAKKQKEFAVEMDRREQKEIEDLVVTRYATGKAGRSRSDDARESRSPNQPTGATHATHIVQADSSRGGADMPGSVSAAERLSIVRAKP